MAVNGKSKGSSFERKIANLLSARFEPITGIKQSFRRNTDSGSYFGGSNQRRVVTHDLDHANFGDLICPKNFGFSIECKFYKTGPSFASLVKGKVTQWDEWIAQAKQDAKNSGKLMMLIVKYNGVDELVFVEAEMLGLTLVLPYTVAPFNTVYGYRFNDFLKLTDDNFFIMDTVKQQTEPAA
jgi:hypothetical protein